MSEDGRSNLALGLAAVFFGALASMFGVGALLGDGSGAAVLGVLAAVFGYFFVRAVTGMRRRGLGEGPERAEAPVETTLRANEAAEAAARALVARLRATLAAGGIRSTVEGKWFGATVGETTARFDFAVTPADQAHIRTRVTLPLQGAAPHLVVQMASRVKAAGAALGLVRGTTVGDPAFDAALVVDADEALARFAFDVPTRSAFTALHDAANADGGSFRAEVTREGLVLERVAPLPDATVTAPTREPAVELTRTGLQLRERLLAYVEQQPSGGAAHGAFRTNVRVDAAERRASGEPADAIGADARGDGRVARRR